jgi:hypothetical protein
MVEYVFEYGRVWQLQELPTRSIALDGAVRGPIVDAAHERYSFDHHGGCVRHATLACCEQVHDALLVGLEPRGFTAYLNAVDADSALGLWLLLHPEALLADDSSRVTELVRALGRFDALGPALGEPPALMTLLEPPPGEAQTRATVERALALIDAWHRGDELPPLPTPETTEALWIEENELRRGEVAGGFRGLYERARFGVLLRPALGGTRDYTIGKASEMVDFDVRRFLARCQELEPGWGGGSTIGGAPRNPDGSRSRLEVEQVGALLLEVARSRRS